MDRKLVESIFHQTWFSLRLFRHVATTVAAEKNLALSPLSVHAFLSLLAAGSKGPTLSQILSTVRSPSAGHLRSLYSQTGDLILADGSAKGGPRFSSVNGIWADFSYPLKNSFKETATSYYKAETKEVDFQNKAVEVTNVVNSWVENATAGLIKDLLLPGSVDSTTRLILGNALYFKGDWDKKFDSSKTQDSDFYLLDGRLPSVQVPFMSSKEKQFISSYDGFSVLKLPYKQGEDIRQFSMYVFLPDARDGLWNLSERLTSEPGFIDHHRPQQKVPVKNFKIPKFKVSFEFEASKVLKDLGLVLPFSSEADLTEMVDSNLFVSLIHHKSVVEVNEEGTEAAAVTMVGFGSSPMPSPPCEFVADHPFLFVIREEKTGAVLFTGHVINPLLAM